MAGIQYNWEVNWKGGRVIGRQLEGRNLGDKCDQNCKHKEIKLKVFCFLQAVRDYVTAAS